MSLFSYFQDIVLAVSRLEDYGLAKAITSYSESRPSGELFINIKVELIDNSVLFIREYISSKQQQIEHFSYAYLQSALTCGVALIALLLQSAYLLDIAKLPCF